MELETVLYRVEGPVAVISLNRTKAMNSLNKQIFADLTTAFNAAKGRRCCPLRRDERPRAALSAPVATSLR